MGSRRILYRIHSCVYSHGTLRKTVRTIGCNLEQIKQLECIRQRVQLFRCIKKNTSGNNKR